MRNISFLFLIAFGILSCSTDGKLPTENSEIVGIWNWKSTDGGFANHIHESPETLGKLYQLTLKSDHSYTIKENGISISKGTFDLSQKESQLFNKVHTFIHFSGDFEGVQGVVLNGMVRRIDQGTLSISDDFHDGIGSTFVRSE